jgi:hypothetical protein
VLQRDLDLQREGEGKRVRSHCTLTLKTLKATGRRGEVLNGGNGAAVVVGVEDENLDSSA